MRVIGACKMTDKQKHKNPLYDGPEPERLESNPLVRRQRANTPWSESQEEYLKRRERERNKTK